MTDADPPQRPAAPARDQPGPPSAPGRANPSTPVRRPGRRKAEGDAERGWGAWIADPRGIVLLTLGSALVIGGGRRWLQVARARRAVEAISGPNPSPDVVAEAGSHGRAGLTDLFRLLGTAEDARVREAAGRALAALWHRDELIVEEEQALVRRGFAVDWRARRRYPRGLKAPIPVEVHFGVPFLRDVPGEVGPDALSWSCRITGAQRAGLEQFSAPVAGPGRARFAIDPGDFATDGPHRLVLHARVHAAGPTSAWDLDLPQIPFTFEFDPRLAVDALLAPADDAEAARVAAAVRWTAPAEAGGAEPRWLEVGPDLLLRDPPALEVAGPLPRDLAHRLAVQFEGVPGRFFAGSVVVPSDSADAGPLRFPIGPIVGIPPDAIERPGPTRMRATLTPSGDLAWADPSVRSLWPGELTTDWAPARLVRR